MTASRRLAALAGAAFLFLLHGCGGGEVLRESTLRRAASNDFVEARFDGPFALLVLIRQNHAASTLTAYIEGDGAVWPDSFHPPRDPTPTDTVVLDMAIADSSSAVAYLGRPCQYLAAKALAHCDPALWVESRYSDAVVEAYDALVDQLLARTGARQLILVGYSGGGILASRLAERRRDVQQWMTVAAPLSLHSWVALTQGTLPEGSDPAEISGPLPPGIHWSGGRDRVVPTSVVEAFVSRRGGKAQVVPEFDHVCCWAKHWRQLLEETRP